MPIAWHAPYELLTPETRDMARAVHSLMEELEAMDWYRQRMDVSDDEGLRRILAHHAEEEKEHAAMLLEWIRRRDPEWDLHLRTYLFTTADIIEVEEQQGSESPGLPRPAAAPQAQAPTARAAGARDAAGVEMPHSFTVGSLRPKR
jgi:ferritin-like protein